MTMLVSNVAKRLVQALAATFNAFVASLAASGGAALVGWIQAGVGAVARTVNAELREREISVTQFGADASGAAVSDAAFLAAITAAVASGVPQCIRVPRGKYKLTKGWAFPVGSVCFWLENAELDFTGLTDPQAMMFAGPADGATVWKLRQKRIIGGNGVIQGPGKASGKHGLVFDTPQNIGTSHLEVDSVLIQGFADAVRIYRNAYIINFSNTLIQENAIGVHMPAGGSNYGERISFIGSCISTNDLAFKGEVAGGNFHLTATSVDYNGVHFDLSGGAGAHLAACHVEGLDYPGTSAIKLAGSGTYFTMLGGVLTGLGGLPQAHASIVDVGADTIAVFDDVFMNNLRNAASVFATGAGRVFVSGHQRFAGTAGLPAFLGTGDSFNLLADPGFEAAAITDEWCITQDTSAITSRVDGANIDLTRQAGGHSGVACLRAVKAAGAQNGAFGLLYEIAERKRFSFSCWYQKPTAWVNGGNVFITMHYARVWRNSAGVPVITRKESAGGVQIATPAAPLIAWTKTADVAPGKLPPPWANHVLIEFNLFDGGSATFDIDDALLTAY